MRVIGPAGSAVYEGVIGGRPHQGVDVPVGVVAFQFAVVYPHHLFHTQPPFQLLFNFLTAQGLVAVRSQQAGAGGEEGALAVALYRASFQHKVVMVLQLAAEDALSPQLAGDGVVEQGLEFFSPSVEMEVEQPHMAFRFVFSVCQGNGAMVACPGVVALTGIDADALRQGRGHSLRCQLPYGIGLGGGYDHTLPLGDDSGELQVGLGYLFEIVFPVGAGMGPGQ